jgi:hypothetical protein
VAVSSARSAAYLALAQGRVVVVQDALHNGLHSTRQAAQLLVMWVVVERDTKASDTDLYVWVACGRVEEVIAIFGRTDVQVLIATWDCLDWHIYCARIVPEALLPPRVRLKGLLNEERQKKKQERRSQPDQCRTPVPPCHQHCDAAKRFDKLG